jgi:hypothetical protein
MKRRLYNLVMLVLLLTMFVQAVVPACALADVSVRCVWASPSSSPCMHAVIPISGATPSQIRCSQMSCCRSKAALMRACGMAMSHMGSSPQPDLHAATCVITVKSLRSSQAAFTPTTQRWMLDAAPAAAPPAAVVSVSLPIEIPVDAPRPQSVPCSPRPSIRSHGLRAPPIS